MLDVSLIFNKSKNWGWVRLSSSQSHKIQHHQFFKWAIPGLIFFIFIFSIQLTINKYLIFNFCRRLDSNRGPVVLEATGLPTEPRPLPAIASVTVKKFFVNWRQDSASAIPSLVLLHSRPEPHVLPLLF